MTRTICRFALATLLLSVLVAHGFAASTSNLVVGVGPRVNQGSWAGYSALNLIPGTSILPIASKTTVFYLAFTGGTQADVSNMVVYKTAGPNNAKISSVTPVKLGGISNPSIVLTDQTVCPNQPVSPTNPCIVRLDPVTLSLSSAADNWLVVYFTASDSNNSNLGGATNQFASPSITGFFDGNDDTQLAVGQSVPDNNNGHSYFLFAVMNN